MVTEAQARATAKYEKKAYDQVKFRAKKGGRAFINDIAKESGKSTAQYLRDLIVADAITKHGQEGGQQARQALEPESASGGGGSMKTR